MKKVFFGLVSLVFAVGFIYSSPTDEQIRQAANTLGVPFNDLKGFVQSYQPQAVPAGALTVTAQDLAAAYKGNQMRADSQYKNKTVQVTGKVRGIKKDIYDEYYVVLDFPVEVYVKAAETNKIANLDIGQSVTMVGTCTGYDVWIIKIKDATLLR
ncbi:MAG: OB-fold putative lipoprotein [Treponema sp.]|jgi:hypothetical protein|nr:OB-fold putative lipoprotein [Treponema sp.]